MASKYGPTRGEHLFRLAVSLFGLGLLGTGLALRGLPTGPALFEVVGFGGAFLVLSAGWSAWHLWKGAREG